MIDAHGYVHGPVTRWLSRMARRRLVRHVFPGLPVPGFEQKEGPT